MRWRKNRIRASNNSDSSRSSLSRSGIFPCLKRGGPWAAHDIHGTSLFARGCPGWEDACESHAAQGGHAGRAQKVEMPKKSEFEGYFCSRRNQKSGSEGIGDNVSGFLDEKDTFLQTWRTRSPIPAAQLCPAAKLRVPGQPQLGVKDSLPFPATPWDCKAHKEKRVKEVTGICLLHMG